jgi:hypothetical protein
MLGRKKEIEFLEVCVRLYSNENRTKQGHAFVGFQEMEVLNTSILPFLLGFFMITFLY